MKRDAKGPLEIARQLEAEQLEQLEASGLIAAKGWTLVRDRESGRPLQVIRPRDPRDAERALAMAKEAHAKQDPDALNEIPSLIRDYIYKGLLARDAKGKPAIIDEHGTWIDTPRPGDSFVTGLDASSKVAR
jgi:hypothetical protein